MGQFPKKSGFIECKLHLIVSFGADGLVILQHLWLLVFLHLVDVLVVKNSFRNQITAATGALTSVVWWGFEA